MPRAKALTADRISLIFGTGSAYLLVCVCV